METAMREKQIPSALARINSLLEELGKEVAIWGDLTAPVMSPQEPIAVDPKVDMNKIGRIPEVLAPLAENLRSIEISIRQIRDSVTRYRSRIEV